MRTTGGGTLRPEKPGNEQEQLDEILKELLGDQMNLRDHASSSRPPTTPGNSLVPAVAPTRGVITTESDNMRTQLSWQTSQAGPTKSAMVARQTVAQPYPSTKVESDSMRYREMTSAQRSPPEVEVDKWGASERYAYEAPSFRESRRVETHSETVRREEIIDQRASQRQLLSTGEPLTWARTPSPSGAGLWADRPALPNSSSPRHSTPYRDDYTSSQPPHEPVRRTASDYRHYASDSEDPMSWLEEQRSKLRGTRTGGRPWKQRSPHEKQLVAELKSAQSAYYTTKRGAQSDTEDGATFDRYGRKGYPRYGPAYSLDEPTLDDTLTKSRFPGPQLSSTRYTFSTGPSYRQPVAQTRSSAPTSPVIPERGDSSREAVLRSQPSAREWLKSSGQ